MDPGAAVLVIALLLAVIAFGPFVVVWALNVIGLAVPYSVWSWVAIVLLVMAFRG
jgi:hypothetical protein